MLSSFRPLRVAFAMLVFALPCLAKDAPIATIDWPGSGTPVLRFTFSKFKLLPGMGNLHGYVMDTTAQNLSPSVIPNARFNVYLFDKNKARVGEDTIQVTNVGPGETIKFETTVMASGTPVSVTLHELQSGSSGSKTISMTVNSTPQGALLKVDGVEEGVTPRSVSVGIGKHILRFSKEGFMVGNFPLEIGPNDVSGGSVSYELGAASFDTVEMRDGSVLNGDLISIAGMDVEIRVAGSIQHIDRNKIKRLVLTLRDSPAPALPPAAANQ